MYKEPSKLQGRESLTQTEVCRINGILEQQAPLPFVKLKGLSHEHQCPQFRFQQRDLTESVWKPVKKMFFNVEIQQTICL